MLKAQSFAIITSVTLAVMLTTMAGSAEARRLRHVHHHPKAPTTIGNWRASTEPLYNDGTYLRGPSGPFGWASPFGFDPMFSHYQ